MSGPGNGGGPPQPSDTSPSSPRIGTPRRPKRPDYVPAVLPDIDITPIQQQGRFPWAATDDSPASPTLQTPAHDPSQHVTSDDTPSSETDESESESGSQDTPTRPRKGKGKARAVEPPIEEEPQLQPQDADDDISLEEIQARQLILAREESEAYIRRMEAEGSTPSRRMLEIRREQEVLNVQERQQLWELRTDPQPDSSLVEHVETDFLAEYIGPEADDWDDDEPMSPVEEWAHPTNPIIPPDTPSGPDEPLLGLGEEYARPSSPPAENVPYRYDRPPLPGLRHGWDDVTHKPPPPQSPLRNRNHDGSSRLEDPLEIELDPDAPLEYDENKRVAISYKGRTLQGVTYAPILHSPPDRLITVPPHAPTVSSPLRQSTVPLPTVEEEPEPPSRPASRGSENDIYLLSPTPSRSPSPRFWRATNVRLHTLRSDEEQLTGPATATGDLPTAEAALLAQASNIQGAQSPHHGIRESSPAESIATPRDRSFATSSTQSAPYIRESWPIGSIATRRDRSSTAPSTQPAPQGIRESWPIGSIATRRDRSSTTPSTQPAPQGIRESWPIGSIATRRDRSNSFSISLPMQRVDSQADWNALRDPGTPTPRASAQRTPQLPPFDPDRTPTGPPAPAQVTHNPMPPHPDMNDDPFACLLPVPSTRRTESRHGIQDSPPLEALSDSSGSTVDVVTARRSSPDGSIVLERIPTVSPADLTALFGPINPEHPDSWPMRRTLPLPARARVANPELMLQPPTATIPPPDWPGHEMSPEDPQRPQDPAFLRTNEALRSQKVRSPRGITGWSPPRRRTQSFSTAPQMQREPEHQQVSLMPSPITQRRASDPAVSSTGSPESPVIRRQRRTYNTDPAARVATGAQQDLLQPTGLRASSRHAIFGTPPSYVIDLSDSPPLVSDPNAFQTPPTTTERSERKKRRLARQASMRSESLDEENEEDFDEIDLHEVEPFRSNRVASPRPSTPLGDIAPGPRNQRNSPPSRRDRRHSRVSIREERPVRMGTLDSHFFTVEECSRWSMTTRAATPAPAPAPSWWERFLPSDTEDPEQGPEREERSLLRTAGLIVYTVVWLIINALLERFAPNLARKWQRRR